MQYEPIKRSLGRFLSGPLFIRKTFYTLLDVLLLRTWHVKKELKRISSHIPGNATVLDAGSGFGQYSWRMSRMNKRWNIDAIDINEQQIEDCSVFFRKAGMSDRVNFRVADLTRLDVTEGYDLILSVDVMEHIKDDQLVFKNFFNSLKEKGKLVISTPSDRGGSDVHDDGDVSFIDEHVRDGYGINEITEKLSLANFKNIKVLYTYGKPGSLSWHLSMKYPVKMLNTSWFFFILLPFYYLMVFPFSVILNIFDIYLTHKTGTGLLVTAEKIST